MLRGPNWKRTTYLEACHTAQAGAAKQDSSQWPVGEAKRGQSEPLLVVEHIIEVNRKTNRCCLNDRDTSIGSVLERDLSSIDETCLLGNSTPMLEMLM